MLKLRPYQERTVAQLRDLEEVWPVRACCQSPTGSGKTLMMAKMLMDDTPQIVLTHRRLLLDQLSQVLSAHNIHHGLRAAGHATDFAAPVQLAMVQTEYSRVVKNKTWKPHRPCARVHIDELPTIKGPQAQKILDIYREHGASTFGWTATPVQVGHLVDHLVVAATVRELIDLGHLVPFVTYTPDGPCCDQLDRVKRQANGEYNVEQLGKVWRADVIFGRVLEQYNILNPDRKPTVLFAGGVAESLYFAQRLSRRCITAAHVDAKNIWVGVGQGASYHAEEWPSDSEHRKRLFAMVKSGEIKVICNRFVLRDGWDQPEIEHVILACVFGSRMSYVQACGRGLRPSPETSKMRCTFQDHGGNAWRFPALDSEEPWDMHSTPAELHQQRVDALRGETETPPADPEPIVCGKCNALRMSGAECPECGFRSSTRSRYVMEISGDLRRVYGPIYKPRRILRTKTDAKTWNGLFWGARRNKPRRTLRQVWTFHAMQNGWRWLPKDLPLMPAVGKDELWGARCGEVALTDLR